MKKLSVAALLFTLAVNAFAHDSAKGNATQHAIRDPFLGSDNSVTLCAREAGKEFCRSMKMPPQLGEVTAIKRGPSIKGATASWFASSEGKEILCAMNVKASHLACAALPKTGSERGQLLSLDGPQLDDAKRLYLENFLVELRDASSKVELLLKKKTKNAAPDVSMPTVIFDGSGGCTFDDWPWDCDEGGGGSGGGGGYDPGPLPPGTAPGDSVRRAECMRTAYSSWNIMDRGCRNLPAREYASCTSANMTVYAEEVTYCNSL